MKKFIFILIGIIVLSCNNSEKSKNTNEKVVKKELRPFFDSDKIDHYYLASRSDFEHSSHDDSLKEDKKKEFSSFFYGNYPETLSDKNFENILLKYNYIQSKLSFKQQKQIENVFSEKDSLKNDACACIAEYRDIFIFKKKAKTVGIAKICFKNARFQIIGSKIDTEGFGLINELNILESIVRSNDKKP